MLWDQHTATHTPSQRYCGRHWQTPPSVWLCEQHLIAEPLENLYKTEQPSQPEQTPKPKQTTGVLTRQGQTRSVARSPCRVQPLWQH